MKKHMVCNQCGKQFKYKDDILLEEVLTVRKDWGFFSKKDLQIHSFALCEECYDRLIQTFAVSVDIEEKTMVMD
ncbi:MAG: hypothetical protein ACI4SQ_05620 [Eubacterium sp.]